MAKRKNKTAVQDETKPVAATQAEQAAENIGLTPGRVESLDAVTPQPEQAALSPEAHPLVAEPQQPLKEGEQSADFTVQEANPAVPGDSEQADAPAPAPEPDSLPNEPTTADEFNEQPSDHPALAPNGNAIYHDEPALVPAGALGGASGEFPEDWEGVDEEGNDVLIPAGTRVEEEAEEDPFDNEEVRQQIAELNTPGIHPKGKLVQVTLGDQPTLFGEVVGHEVIDSAVRYFVSFLVAAGNVITGAKPQTVILPIPGEYVA